MDPYSFSSSILGVSDQLQLTWAKLKEHCGEVIISFSHLKLINLTTACLYTDSHSPGSIWITWPPSPVQSQYLAGLYWAQNTLLARRQWQARRWENRIHIGFPSNSKYPLRQSTDRLAQRSPRRYLYWEGSVFAENISRYRWCVPVRCSVLLTYLATHCEHWTGNSTVFDRYRLDYQNVCYLEYNPAGREREGERRREKAQHDKLI